MFNEPWLRMMERLNSFRFLLCLFRFRRLFLIMGRMRPFTVMNLNWQWFEDRWKRGQRILYSCSEQTLFAIVYLSQWSAESRHMRNFSKYLIHQLSRSLRLSIVLSYRIKVLSNTFIKQYCNLIFPLCLTKITFDLSILCYRIKDWFITTCQKSFAVT